jgi:hypothetical protein
MKVNFDKQLVDLDGTIIPDAKGNPAILRGISVDALLAAFNDEQNIAGEEKLKRYILAEKIYKKEDDLSVEELALLKKLIGKAYTPLIVGQSWKIIEEGENGFKE